MLSKSMGPGSAFIFGNNSNSFNLNKPKYNGAYYKLNLWII